MTNEPNTPAPESFEARTYDDGKYTVFKRHDGGLGFLRHGEAWPAADDLRWQNVVMEMFREQIEADALVAKLRGELEAEKAVREGAEKKQERAESAWTKLDNEYAALQTSADETDGKLEAEKAVSKGLREAFLKAYLWLDAILHRYKGDRLEDVHWPDATETRDWLLENHRNDLERAFDARAAAALEPKEPK